ncbi:MAG: DNRLRE domain-containing protein [Flavisolibacter sp.]|nr:DNRLRE domain-containing protein [Flavisolibacter sp.]
MKILPKVLPVVIIIFFLAACKKETLIENKPPVVNAGNDTTFQLAAGAQNDTISLSGSAIDADGQVVGYAWSQISGPNTVKILYPGSATTKISGVISGQYVFQLMATDDKGATGVKSVTILVKAPQVYTLTLQPNNNPNESSVYSYVPNGNGVGTPQLAIGAWTNSGTPVYNRTYIKFDYTIPAGATILSAKFSLYAIPNPLAGNFVDAHYGLANSFNIQRITAAWTATSISWNNQPATTTVDQITVPNSTSSFQNNNDIDVTQLVKDMQQNGNNGFALRLLTENYYNIRQYISSYNTDLTKHPKLVIQYSN